MQKQGIKTLTQQPTASKMRGCCNDRAQLKGLE